MKEKALEKIKVFVFDVDGVLTEGSLILLPDGTQARVMNVKDGFGLQEALNMGFEIVIISKGNSPEVTKRLNLLGVKHVYMQEHNKIKRLEDVLDSLGYTFENAIYIGDDIPDIECIKTVGYSACPLDAVEEVQDAVDFIIPVLGGRGVARHIIKKVLTAQGKWKY
ncbi:KdsC family phosphatase [Rhizosphaericola mali]|uniref:HAD hydrolase family protein n=1 Tax=Rhizosphaericola mali TaxID=2545455 RepID=A0A5P2G8G1_9BACT|nr:HAD hydrolase family protein [Rhizosphaericola mali]QES87801.1 HAD hydrolase family protein [Rhizosphaericola mali]